MNKILLFISSFFLLSSLFFTTLAHAGGGPVGVETFALRPFDQTQTFIVKTDVTTHENCGNIKPKLTLKDTIAGDEISPFTPPNDGTYLTRHFYAGGAWKELCINYFSVKSGEKRQRTAEVNVVVNGKNETRGATLSFGDDHISKQIQGFGRYNDHDNSPHADVVGEKHLGGTKREVSLQWQKISWAGKYSVFTREFNFTDPTVKPRILMTTTQDTKTVINLSTSTEFYLSIMACKADEPCTDPKENMYEMLLGKMQNVNSGAQEEIKAPVLDTPQVIETPVINSPKSSPVNEKVVEELNQKVASLEGQLQDSWEKQRTLEQRINDLFAFIKKIFPFFN